MNITDRIDRAIDLELQTNPAPLHSIGLASQDYAEFVAAHDPEPGALGIYMHRGAIITDAKRSFGMALWRTPQPKE